MAREDLHFRLRIPEDLKTQVEAAATENRRSMTAEIVWRLGQYDELQKLSSDLERMERALLKRLEEVKSENEELRYKIAYQEGVIASLRSHLQIFIQHLAKPGSGQTEVFDQIMADVREFQAKSEGAD